MSARALYLLALLWREERWIACRCVGRYCMRSNLPNESRFTTFVKRPLNAPLPLFSVALCPSLVVSFCLCLSLIISVSPSLSFFVSLSVFVYLYPSHGSVSELSPCLHIISIFIFIFVIIFISVLVCVLVPLILCQTGAQWWTTLTLHITVCSFDSLIELDDLPIYSVR